MCVGNVICVCQTKDDETTSINLNLEHEHKDCTFTSVTFCLNDLLIASGSNDGKIQLWTSSGDCVKSIRVGKTSFVILNSFTNPNERFVTSGGLSLACSSNTKTYIKNILDMYDIFRFLRQKYMKEAMLLIIAINKTKEEKIVKTQQLALHEMLTAYYINNYFEALDKLSEFHTEMKTKVEAEKKYWNNMKNGLPVAIHNSPTAKLRF